MRDHRIRSRRRGQEHRGRHFEGLHDGSLDQKPPGGREHLGDLRSHRERVDVLDVPDGAFKNSRAETVGSRYR
jgi:hypothetical protein